MQEASEGQNPPKTVKFIFDDSSPSSNASVDQWILSFTANTLKITKEEMKFYRLAQRSAQTWLRGEFKAVTQAIKELTDAQLQEFLVKKEIVVNGYVLGEQDLRLMFSFSGPRADELSQRYEAHSEGNILILLDITPDESMLNEGIAREVINRVQKLRKKRSIGPH
ncbi:hypothetical protein KQX54_000589 [Cotesia glomerata]|uniref:Uncharacterized protein n=1 Tax=Cotesia glomerata TaxID=32391 RepID=A0AAV7IKG8_COTGL|nr:hypothetical protein KQX54_000589 [Cotesia glomerata]